MRRVFIFSETAFHHEGDLDFMLGLIDATVEARVDGIKFQVLINFDELIARTNPSYEKLSKFVFSLSQWRTILDYAIERDLDIVIMPLDIDAFQLVSDYKGYVRFVELHSVAFNDRSLKQKIKETNVPIILGIGGRTREEIEEAFTFFGNQLEILMTGFQSFPSVIQDIRLSRIKNLTAEFPGTRIGYADHSGFDDPWGFSSNLVAHALGATVFEKHITTSPGQVRVDYESAIDSVLMRKIKESLDALDIILFGYHDPFAMSPAEENYRKRQKIVVAKFDLSEGVRLSSDHLCLKMAGTLDGYSRIEDLIGKTLINPRIMDSVILPEDVAN